MTFWSDLDTILLIAGHDASFRYGLSLGLSLQGTQYGLQDTPTRPGELHVSVYWLVHFPIKVRV